MKPNSFIETGKYLAFCAFTSLSKILWLRPAPLRAILIVYGYWGHLVSDAQISQCRKTM